MNKLEMIVFAIVAVIAAIVVFDFVTYVVKSAPKRAHFNRRVWFLGLLCVIAIVYWYINGMKFL